MMLRPVIEIDTDKCDGCGKCVLDCAEGALAIVDGKARLVSDVYCDGLGACLDCPRKALRLEMREAPAFDEKAALAAKAARQNACSDMPPRELKAWGDGLIQAQVDNWPQQLALVPSTAGFLKDAEIILCAHCAGFSVPDIHAQWLKDRIAIIACPKLQDNAMLNKRLTEILKDNPVKSLTVLRMGVPCCAGLARIAGNALKESESALRMREYVVKL